jgi:hypothetical protein
MWKDHPSTQKRWYRPCGIDPVFAFLFGAYLNMAQGGPGQQTASFSVGTVSVSGQKFASTDFYAECVGYPEHSNFLISNNCADGPSTETLRDYAPVAAFAGAFLGCLTTLGFTVSGVPPEIASALATAVLCGELLLIRAKTVLPPVFFSALYGGSFGGMTSVLELSNGASGCSAARVGGLFIALSLVCGLAFFVVAKLDTRSTAPIASGHGGRSGAIATVASFLFIVLCGLWGADARLFHGIETGALSVEPQAAGLWFFACMVGILVTLCVLQQRQIASAKVADRTFIASSLAVFGLAAIHFSLAGDARTSDAFYAGCFLGMSTPERFKGWLQPTLGAVMLSCVLVLVRAVLPGVGGSLGFAAFVTSGLLVALRHVADRMLQAAARTTLGGSLKTDPPRALVLLERTPPNLPFEPRSSSALKSFAWLGAATATGSIAAFFVLGSLLRSDDALPYRLAGEASRYDDVRARAPIALQSVTTMPHLVIAEAGPGEVDDLIPLGVSLINADADDTVILSGLSSGSNITNGRPWSAHGWRLFAHELANAAIRPAPGFIGGADITVELRRAGLTIDRRSLHVEWIGGASRTASEGRSLPPTRSYTGRTLVDGTTGDHETLFREFLQWSAKR